VTETTTSYGALIYKTLQEKLHLYINWNIIETEIAIQCSRIPQTNSRERKEQAVKVLKDIKEILQKHKTTLEDMQFIDEEIERFDKTIEIYQMVEKDDYVDEQTINKYAQLSTGIQGIINTHIAFNYEQLKKLSLGVYKQEKTLRFYISPEITIGGKIVAEIFEYPQDIPVCTLCTMLSEKKQPDTETVFFFGEKVRQNEWRKIKELTAKFYIYRFISDTKQEYIALSPQKIGIGDYIINGVTTPVLDLKNVSESLKITTNHAHIFIHSFEDKIIRYADAEDFRAKLGIMNITKSTIWNVPFTVAGQDKILIYPEWFKWLIWSWILHTKHGLSNKYPLHLLIIGPKGSGKTQLINNIHHNSLESGQVFSGVSSTLKDIIPSFHHIPPKIGYLAESNRFAFLDEFLRCITRSSSTQDLVDENVALMNDLLEHQQRRAGSGKGSGTTNMTARILAVTNPVRAVKNVTDLLEKYDTSFLCRWLILWQGNEFIKTARETPEDTLKTTTYKINTSDFISIIDFMQSIKTEYDATRLTKIMNAPKVLMNEKLLDHYNARHRHHIICLLDGVIKARCMIEHDITFKAKEEDYERVTNIWANVIKSWIDGESIEKLPIEIRHHYIPEMAQYAYKVICEEKAPMTRWRTEELLLSKDMEKTEYIASMMILQRAELIIQKDEVIKPWWMKDEDERAKELNT
jgi:GTPase SAR1 family protein